jgi:hypothetical protein
MSNERDELSELIFEQDVCQHKGDARDVADAILAAGYRRPQQVTTVEELDALPVGSVVLSEEVTHHEGGWALAYQRWQDGDWHRGARSGSTHPDNFLPATALHVGGGS